MTIVILFFITCIILFLYSYFLYSPLLVLLSKVGIHKNKGVLSTSPRKISIVISAFNEERSIKEVLLSILESKYLEQEVAVYVGSDGSTDHTDSIVLDLTTIYSNIHFKRFQRIGKGNVINQLILENNLNRDHSLIVLMDANILLEKDCLYHLYKASQYDAIGIVGASVRPLKDEINTESQYILKENEIKYLEGHVFGSTIGIFGACYAIKGECFVEIPKHFITDDLFESFVVVRQKKCVVYSNEAICREVIDADIMNEFYRKKRYGAGNIQILRHFIDLLNPWTQSFGFIYCYWNHKLVRWFAPWWGLSIWITSLFLTNYNPIFFVIKWVGWILIGTIVLNLWLIKKNKKPLLNRLFYYLMMNIALLLGALNYIKGINTNVWNRSNRN